MDVSKEVTVLFDTELTYTFRYNSKYSILNFSLGYCQSFNLENPRVA